MYRSISLALAATLSICAFAQADPFGTNPCPEIVVAKMSVMVMPRVGEGETPRKVWDSKPDDRIAVAKVKEFFQGRGFQTVDFETKLKSIEETGVLTLQNQSDHMSEVIRRCGAEIVLEVDMTWQEENGLCRATIILKATETAGAMDMGTTTEQSNQSRSCDKAAHAMGAVEVQADKFLNQMQANFIRLDVEGRPINMQVTYAEGSQYDSDTEVTTANDEPLSDVIIDWIRSNAFRKSMQQPSPSPKAIEFPEVRIPMRDATTCQSYISNDFAKALRGYMKSINVPVKTVVKGNKILVTVQ